MRSTGRRVHRQHIEPGLRAVQPLHIERLAIARPIDAAEIDVLVRSQVHLNAMAAIGIHQPQRDIGIGAAGCGIALVISARAIGADRRACHHAHGRLVKAFHGEAFFIGPPPEPAHAVEFFLGNELRLAPVDGFGGFLRADRARRRLAIGRRDPQPAIAHEGQGIALRPQARVQLAPGGAGNLAHLAIKASEQQVAIERHQHGLAVTRPIIADDALEIAYALALALHLFRLAQHPARRQLERIDQHRPLAGLAIKAPQVEPLAIVGAVLEQGEIAPIGRQLHAARGGSVERGAGEHPFERQHGSGAGRGHRGCSGRGCMGKNRGADQRRGKQVKAELHGKGMFPISKKGALADMPGRLFHGHFRVAAAASQPSWPGRVSRRSAIRALLPVRPRR